MIAFIKIHKRLVAVFVAFVIFIIFLAVIFAPRSNQNGSGSQLPSVLGFFGIKPGETKKSDVVAKLGQPVSETKRTNTTIDEFKSASLNRTHEIIFDTSNIVRISKQVITAGDRTTVSDIVKVYGESKNILYGDDSVNGVNLYVYPDKGIAMLANLNSNTLFEVWYFTPTTMDQFTANFAIGYSTDIQQVKPSF